MTNDLVIQRHSANQKMIRIKGLQIREVPQYEGGGYYLIGDVAEKVVSIILAYQNKRLLDALAILELTEGA